jgi:hypothetical protein
MARISDCASGHGDWRAARAEAAVSQPALDPSDRAAAVASPAPSERHTEKPPWGQRWQRRRGRLNLRDTGLPTKGGGGYALARTRPVPRLSESVRERSPRVPSELWRHRCRSITSPPIPGEAERLASGATSAHGSMTSASVTSVFAVIGAAIGARAAVSPKADLADMSGVSGLSARHEWRTDTDSSP